MPDTIIRARITPELKEQATKVLANMGLTPSEAIRLFFHQIVNENALPFKVKASYNKQNDNTQQPDNKSKNG